MFCILPLNYFTLVYTHFICYVCLHAYRKGQGKSEREESAGSTSVEILNDPAAFRHIPERNESSHTHKTHTWMVMAVLLRINLKRKQLECPSVKHGEATRGINIQQEGWHSGRRCKVHRPWARCVQGCQQFTVRPSIVWLYSQEMYRDRWQTPCGCPGLGQRRSGL